MTPIPIELAAHQAGSNESITSRRLTALELVVFWRDEIRSYRLPEHGEITIGRAEDNDVRIEHASVSRQHAVLRFGASISIEDLGGANGTFVRNPARGDKVAETLSMKRLASESAEIAIGETMMLGEVTMLLRRAPESISSFGDLTGDQEPASGFVVTDPKMKAVYAQAELAAQAMITLLILGETGVGKELLARAVHARSRRAQGPYLSINCAALSESLLEGELFGYEKGAFTGATQARAGLFEAADGGSLFLDEIGEIAPGTQAKLLRVLEERKVTRLGARQPREIDVRFVAATNRDLESEVRAGRFRQDLFFRINGLCLTIPPLRERPTEIEPLARTFLAAARAQIDRKDGLTFSTETLALLGKYAWPGNVRELKNVIERAVVLCTGPAIRPEHLPASLLGSIQLETLQRAEPTVESAAPPSPPASGLGSSRWHAEIKALERRRLTEALNRCAGNQTQAAKLLGISRRTLVSRLSEFNMPRPRKRD